MDHGQGQKGPERVTLAESKVLGLKTTGGAPALRAGAPLTSRQVCPTRLP
mgnify:CR=1 FL=1